MQSKHLKWALILLALYVLYKRFLSKKEDFELVAPIVPYPAGTTPLAGTTSVPVATDVRNLVQGVFYQRGTLKSGIRNTQTDAKNGGTTCTEFPSTIYIPLSPVDAVCELGPNNIKAYSQITETSAACPLVNGVPTKSLNKIADVAAFNKATTTTPAQYGGRDCFTQKNNFLNYIELFPCTSPLPAICADPTTNISAYYDASQVPDSFTNCSINVGGVWNKTISKRTDTDINSRAQTRQAYNGGATCSAQNASLSETRNVPCGVINSTCVGNDPSGIKSNVNSNYTLTIPSTSSTPVAETSTFWSTCRLTGASFTSTENPATVCCSKSAITGTTTCA